ncbi:hypothetical protein A2115_00035 [Candidatus Woesebacteria bacterium GWA1_41_8]|jgi:hypothetical protein|uniref:Uncharacterized protein n=1 Tax=Candidatus Woesebacteria bacterium GWA1_41_8 TaxID=1802471 RepID=A0A1F7WK18_9BACT|nr:MAG: hypothetical protein A2115_00035 [Candidatus Woesebacteria bacterium GWA1_41_8]
MRENLFDTGESSLDPETNSKQTLYCPIHRITFYEVDYPLNETDRLKKKAAESVAIDHMGWYGCRLIELTPKH